MGVLYLDATTAAPSDTWEGRGKTMEVMSQITYDLLVNDENDELLSYLEAHADELDAQTKREVEVLRKSYDQIHRIPAEEYVAYSVLINDAESVWHKAKPEDDFAAFAASAAFLATISFSLASRIILGFKSVSCIIKALIPIAASKSTYSP